MTMHAALTGNAVAIKVRVDGRTVELIPLPPGSFSIERPARYRTLYRCYDEFGHLGDFGPEDVFHLPAWQWEVVRGLDALRLARAAVGLSIAAEETQGALHRNGGRPSGVLSTDKTTSPEAVERLRLAWRKFTQEGRSGTAILDNGFTYKPLVQTGVEGQHLETRRFQVEEICRAFGVFPIMIGHSDKAATFASTEAFFGAHVRHTLMPWWQLWRQRLDEFVLDGAGPLFTDFDGRYLLAGSVKDRAMWARTMTEMGIYTRNEIREEEGRDPLPGLDEPLTPMNMSKTGAARSDDQGSSDNAP
jgi:HK97 family phage portal protein